MGEFVSEMQERLLPEYEKLLHYQIYTPDQVRECIRSRERLQLKTTQSHTAISDYINYIVYEKQMYKLIAEKEKLSGLKFNDLKSSIATRIIRLYRTVVGKFWHDERLWSSFIRFSKKSTPQEVAAIYENMLSFHGDKPEVWVNAALWLYEYNRMNITRVRDLLLRGLQRHPTSECLHKCFFDIQLKEAALSDSTPNLSDNTVSELDIAMECVNAVYSNSRANVTEVDYFVKLLESCVKHGEFTAKLQRQIVDDMQEKFAREPALWHALAQRELQGYHLSDLQNLEKTQRGQTQSKPSNSITGATADDAALVPSDSENYSEDDQANKPRLKTSSVWQSRTLKQRIELCVAVYKTAVQVLQTQEMWCLYIDAMLALNMDNTTARSLKQSCLMNALHDGHHSKIMHIEHYVTLHDILFSNPNGGTVAVRVFSEALEHDQSLRMHELLLATHILNDNEASVFELFNQARKTLGGNAVPIWQRVIAFYRARYDAASEHRLEQIFSQACAETSQEFVPLRCDFLSYCWHNHSPAKARDEYKRLAIQPPISLQLHRQMADLEAGLTPSDVKSWRMCYEYMTGYFGKKEPSVWLEYIAFERDYGEAKNIALVSQRALTTLDPQLVGVFEAQRALAHVGN